MLTPMHGPLPEELYQPSGDIIDGIPQIVPDDGWYWLQIGRGSRVQWHMCYIKGMWVHTLIEIFHWSKADFHERHRIGPRVDPPTNGAEPYFPEHSQHGH